MEKKIIKRNIIDEQRRKVDLQVEKCREQRSEERKWND